MPNLPAKYRRNTGYLPYRKQNQNIKKEIKKNRKCNIDDETDTTETANNDNELLDDVNSPTQSEDYVDNTKS